jgi:hypothetical protein
MKFKIKSLDDKVSERPALVEKVNSFLYELYRDEDMFTGMQIEEDPNRSVTFSIGFNWKIENTIFISLLWPQQINDPITVTKTKYGENMLFTKEELKFFDLLDLEVDFRHYAALKQNITDWTSM